MAKTWVLETHTKGTGANIVPLDAERGQDRPEHEREVQFVHSPTKPRPPKPPPARRPRRFTVVDVTTREVLAEDASSRETLAALREVRSMVDVAVSVWSEKRSRYRLLTHAEQKAVWDMRGAPLAGGGP
jgi:hypothetical protein